MQSTGDAADPRPPLSAPGADGGIVRVRPRTAGTWLFAFVVFTVACAGSWGWFVWRDRTATVEELLARPAFVARLFEEQAAQAIVAGDRILVQVVGMVRGWDLKDAEAGDAIRMQMRALINRDERIVSAWVVDAAGILILDSRDTPPPPLDLTYRDYYRAHLHAVSDLFVGSAEFGVLTRRTRFTLSRAVRDADGRLRSVVTLGISGDYFSALAASAAGGLGPASGVAVFSKSHQLLAQASTSDPFSAEAFSLSRARMNEGRVQRGAELTDVGGARRVVAFSGASDLVTVVATLPAAEVLDDWLTRTIQSGSVLLAAIVAFGVVAVRGVRLAGREATALARLRELNVQLDDRVRERAAELANSEQRYRALTEASAAVVWRALPDGRTVDIPEWRAITGQSVDEVRDLGWLDALHPEDRDSARSARQRAIEAQTAYELEYRVRTVDGDYRWFSSRGVPILSPDGSVREWVGVCVDIDERKRAEQELRARTAQLEAIIETVPAIVMFTHGPDAGLMSANRYGQDLLRIKPGIVPSRAAPGNLGPQAFRVRKDGVDLPPADLPLQRAARGEEVKGEEVELVFEDGSSYAQIVNAAPIRDAGGEPVGAVAVAIDITERKRVEEELRARTTELETVLDTVPAVVFIVHGRDAEYISYSRHGQELLRRAPGRNRSRMAPGERDNVQFTIRKNGAELTPETLPLHRAARGEAVGDEEIEVVFDDGTSVTLLLHAAPIWNATGEPVGAVGAAIDITERKRADDRQKLIMAELDHRVRNTLATIQSILTLAEKSGQSKAEFADAVRGRVDALARAHGLLIQTQWRGASLARLVTDELQPYGSGDHARLQIAGADLLLQPKAAVLIALVIHELATNAAKYGALSVRRGGVAVAWGVEGNASERRLRLTWAESGGPAVEKPLRRGFGSKLIESSLVQEFDADVRLDFAPAGVRCTASIPLRLIAAENVALAKAEDTALFAFPAQTASLAGARILLVEDDALIGLDLKDGLEEAGAKIVGPIARLDRALALAATDEIDAAVLDVNLGGERVFPLADRLVQLGVPFAFLTGYDKHAVFPDRYRGVPALQKPVSRPAIAAMVERLTVRQAAVK